MDRSFIAKIESKAFAESFAQLNRSYKSEGHQSYECIKELIEHFIKTTPKPPMR